MFLPHTETERREMLRTIGVNALEQLFADIPSALRLKGQLNLPPSASEAEIWRELRRLAAVNRDLDTYPCFLGAGAYDHLIPAAVTSIVSRGEFLTAYTPYQAEISQGELQAMWEYQSMMVELTGMDVANSSMYDGATALAEAALLASAVTGQRRVLVPQNVHPEYREVTATYLRARGLEMVDLPFDRSSGQVDLAALAKELEVAAAAVVVQNPNFFGIIETEAKQAVELAHKAGALAIVVADPISLAILTPPGELGADIAVGNGQPLGNPISFGGPHFGFFAARQELLRRLPGRIVGETVDRQGRRGFVLALQTREQHIRREKATSNICTNQAHNALMAAVYLALLGPQGLREVAEACLQKSHYAAERLQQIPGCSLAFSGPFYQEFVLTIPVEPAELTRQLLAAGIIGPLPLASLLPGEEWAHKYLVCVTEARSREEIDRLVTAVTWAVNAAAGA
ncbi:MAG: aminomethyl-transferring glycine dehydrogenase subunit GcvPA [Limnochordales bacterium]|nr:aminomethyl-transferring glycine dehydrogenase subunit GcvPA [Limnochordales bacterium]